MPSSSGEPLSSPEHTRTTTHDTHHVTTQQTPATIILQIWGHVRKCRVPLASPNQQWDHLNHQRKGATDCPSHSTHQQQLVHQPKGKGHQAGKCTPSQPIWNRAAPYTVGGTSPRRAHCSPQGGHIERAPQPAQPLTRKRHQQEHRLPKHSDPTQHLKERTGDCPGPCEETATRWTTCPQKHSEAGGG